MSPVQFTQEPQRTTIQPQSTAYHHQFLDEFDGPSATLLYVVDLPDINIVHLPITLELQPPIK
jgi:hypothetical protein